MKVLMAASEVFPFCKTGGLADVTGSLPVALAEGGDEVAVILPLYDLIGGYWREKMTSRGYIYIDLGWRHQYCGLYSLEYRGVTWYFVDNEQYFRRGKIYGEFDDGERFAFFCKAVVDLLPSLNWMPDVIHCNDWQTALIPVYLKDVGTRWEAVRNIHTVFTIHNVEYQGRYGHEMLTDVFGLNEGWWSDGTLQMDGDINLMKAALMVSDKVTTVSPTYAHQLHNSYYAHRMESVIDRIGDKLRGVLNGLDVVTYDPATDSEIPERYSVENMTGKAVCKACLQAELGLQVDPKAPIIAVVSRMARHKGIDMICEVLDKMMIFGIQVVVLGKGEGYLEDFFKSQASHYGGRLAVRMGYDESLSHRVYAGSDMLLMPSKSEPCGLSQMIAMRYGTVPIVRKTGGLNDSVRSCQAGQENGTGFVFENYNPYDMLYVIGQAVEMYHRDAATFAAVQKNGMTEDFSWNKSAGVYHEIYSGL